MGIDGEFASELVEGLSRAGFDAVAFFDAERFNESVGPDDFRLPDFGLSHALGLVIGNSQAFWDPFTRALDANERLRGAEHPVDAYTEAHVRALRERVELPSQAFFAHQPAPRIPIQRIARAAGLAELSPSHMSVHPVFGPWLGLRAVVVFACAPLTPMLGAAEARHCPECSAPCMGALERALDSGQRPELGWQRWLAVRDACPAGTEHRYGPNQIRYHYTKDRTALAPEGA
jgi:methylmalonic aciduria homocystinuria type C protein